MKKQLTWIVVVTMFCSPALTYGAERSSAAEAKAELTLKNVELTAPGSLEGRMLTPTGAPVRGAKLVVRDQKDFTKVSHEVTTDEDGRFRVDRLSPGTCVLENEGETFAVRVWAAGTAPPRSLKKVALIHETDDDTVRGQMFANTRLGRWVRSLTPKQKLGLGLLIGAAIAIPIALDDDAS